MFTGKQFHLKEGALGIEAMDGQQSVVIVPAGEVVRVLSGPLPHDRRMVDVLWGKRTIVMFTKDIEACGEEVRTTTGTSR